MRVTTFPADAATCNLIKKYNAQQQAIGSCVEETAPPVLFATGCTTYLPATIQSGLFEGPSDRLQGHHRNSLHRKCPACFFLCPATENNQSAPMKQESHSAFNSIHHLLQKS